MCRRYPGYVGKSFLRCICFHHFPVHVRPARKWTWRITRQLSYMCISHFPVHNFSEPEKMLRFIERLKKSACTLVALMDPMAILLGASSSRSDVKQITCWQTGGMKPCKRHFVNTDGIQQHGELLLFSETVRSPNSGGLWDVVKSAVSGGGWRES